MIHFKRDAIIDGKLVVKDRAVRIRDLFHGRKIVKWWIGTDALTLLCFPPGKWLWYVRIIYQRLFYKIVKNFIEHWVVGEHLGFYLKEFGITDYHIIQDPAQYTHVIKKSHQIKSVLYYYPGNHGNRIFKEWVYGYDVFSILKAEYPDINWITVNGDKDMSSIYPVIDGCIRPNRHDGISRIILECQEMNIPYCTSVDLNELRKFVENL